ncbi:hypothetical protein EDD18DRAFT_1173411 [Armillaria luteobubalina]|uniref:Uncharacterized protein n=1 Tax=Armillaria luteobubalina TaxID=153913 RepID=A0AA39UVT5_9AGAR|nr:hypothetical protein EDD18DRAFT_1173411 [Armillaria luteobubalina]
MISNSSEVKVESRRRSSKFSLTPGTEGAPLPSPMIERPDKPLFPSDVGLNGRRYSPLSSPGGSTESCGSVEGITEISALPSLPHSEESSLSSDAPTRSVSARSFISSPLNPSNIHSTARHSMPILSELRRMPSEDIRAICNPSNMSLKSSMILYRVADEAPPKRFQPHPNRNSLLSTSGDSVLSLSSDSKYPSAVHGVRSRGLVAYAFDPLAPDLIVDDDDDKTLNDTKVDRLSPRGVANVAALVCLLIAIISLFVVYPIVTFYKHNYKNRLIAENPFINSTGQAEDTIPHSRHGVRSQVPFSLISSYDLPIAQDVVNKPEEYTLIFKDEFDRDNRPLINGNDPVWHATVYSKSFFARIFKSQLVLDGSAGAVRLHRPVCMKSDGYLEISYRYSDDQDIKKFAWYPESEVPSWLGLTIELGGDDRRRKEQAVWIEYVKVYEHSDASSSGACLDISPTNNVVFSPYVSEGQRPGRQSV